MKRITFVLLYAALGVAASAQTIWVRTNEISGNVSPSESLTAVAGAIRLTVYSTDGGGSADLSGTAVRFLITDLRDDKVIVSNSPAVVVTNSVHRGEATLSAGSPYAVRLMAYPEGNDPYALYWATLTVTNPPSAGGASVSITSTSVVDIGNLTVQWEIQGDGDLAPDGTDRTISPHTDLGASLGRTNERYDEAHVRAGYFENLQAGTVSVEYAIGFLDNTKVKLTGETNTVDLTNASVHARSPTGDVEVATKGYVDSVAGGNALVESIGSYQYTGGETTVSFAWTQQYSIITVQLSGDLLVIGSNENGNVWSAVINSQPGWSRTIFRYDASADAFPASIFYIAGFTNAVGLQLLPKVNDTTPWAYARSLGTGLWTLTPSPRGVQVRGDGYSYFNGADIISESFGNWRNPLGNDLVGRSIITALQFAAYGMTNGAVFSTRSNAIVRLWGTLPE